MRTTLTSSLGSICGALGRGMNPSSLSCRSESGEFHLAGSGAMSGRGARRGAWARSRRVNARPAAANAAAHGNTGVLHHARRRAIADAVVARNAANKRASTRWGVAANVSNSALSSRNPAG